MPVKWAPLGHKQVTRHTATRRRYGLPENWSEAAAAVAAPVVAPIWIKAMMRFDQPNPLYHGHRQCAKAFTYGPCFV